MTFVILVSILLIILTAITVILQGVSEKFDTICTICVTIVAVAMINLVQKELIFLTWWQSTIVVILEIIIGGCLCWNYDTYDEECNYYRLSTIINLVALIVASCVA